MSDAAPAQPPCPPRFSPATPTCDVTPHPLWKPLSFLMILSSGCKTVPWNLPGTENPPPIKVPQSLLSDFMSQSPG